MREAQEGVPASASSVSTRAATKLSDARRLYFRERVALGPDPLAAALEDGHAPVQSVVGGRLLRLRRAHGAGLESSPADNDFLGDATVGDARGQKGGGEAALADVGSDSSPRRR